MQVGLTILSPAGGITVLARALFVIVLLCLAVPAVAGVWVSMHRRTRRDSESGETLDLDALRELIEKAKEERSSNSTANEDAS